MKEAPWWKAFVLSSILSIDRLNLLAEVSIELTDEGLEQLPVVAALGTRPNLNGHHFAFCALELDPALVFRVRPFCAIALLGARSAERAALAPIELNFLFHDLPEQAASGHGYDLQETDHS